MTITIKQVRKLMKEKAEGALLRAAMKSNMSIKTARKYAHSKDKADKEEKPERKTREHRTRKDPFEYHWEEIVEMLEVSPGLEAKTVMCYLMEQYPEVYNASHERTLQRRMSQWRLKYGPSKLAIFRQNMIQAASLNLIGRTWASLKSLLPAILLITFCFILFFRIRALSPL